jgi:hypothetical protein
MMVELLSLAMLLLIPGSRLQQIRDHQILFWSSSPPVDAAVRTPHVVDDDYYSCTTKQTYCFSSYWNPSSSSPLLACDLLIIIAWQSVSTERM